MKNFYNAINKSILDTFSDLNMGGWWDLAQVGGEVSWKKIDFINSWIGDKLFNDGITSSLVIDRKNRISPCHYLHQQHILLNVCSSV